MDCSVRSLTDGGIFAAYMEDHDSRHYYCHDMHKASRYMRRHNIERTTLGSKALVTHKVGK